MVSETMGYLIVGTNKKTTPVVCAVEHYLAWCRLVDPDKQHELWFQARNRAVALSVPTRNNVATRTIDVPAGDLFSASRTIECVDANCRFVFLSYVYPFAFRYRLAAIGAYLERFKQITTAIRTLQAVLFNFS